MEWREEGIVLGVRRHGETGAIVDLLTGGRGRWTGLVRGGRSRTQRPVLQEGNLVLATWRARLEEHLGNFAIEPLSLRSGWLIDDPGKLAALTTLTCLCQLLPEREPHSRLYEAARLVLDALDEPAIWPALFVRWELGLLDELGFGLDLGQCAATGTREGLVYVSPRTGRAVSREAGEPYRDRLLRLPEFLNGSQAATPNTEDIIDGFRLTGHFLSRHIFEPRNVDPPDCRERMIARILQNRPGSEF
ncbi:MAG: DNA repair protein RecO [Rhizobiales bacterium]|nr:DNA repair protein RecO [Hyphomicrobiales bacterium]